MGKKENLQKAIAVSMMMTNIFCTPVWADPVEGTPGTDGAAIVHNDDISSGINTVYTADNGRWVVTLQEVAKAVTEAAAVR